MNIDTVNRKVLEIVLSTVKSGAIVKWSPIADLILQLEHSCAHKVHRLQPLHASDWRAVDHMMSTIVDNLCHSVRETIDSIGEINTALLTETDDSEAATEKIMHGIDKCRTRFSIHSNFTNIHSMILKQHYKLLREYDHMDGCIDADAKKHFAAIVELIAAYDTQRENKHESESENKERRSADQCVVPFGSTHQTNQCKTH